MKPVVAIVGRPNVGKSTLFNRITRSRDALVDDLPGVTRDRHFGDAVWDDHAFTLVDTGGFLDRDEDRFANEIRFQVRQAIEDADAVMLVLDGKNGLSPFDTELVELLRTLTMPVFYLVNKIDGEHLEKNLFEFYALGLTKLFPVSGEHRYGVPDLLDELVKVLPGGAEEEIDEETVSLAVVGRPNVGKSSLINKILGEKRLVVSDVAGTTRDAVDSYRKVKGRQYRLIDTAGIRRKKKVSEKLEKFSIIKSLKSLDRCDVALILVDASEGITDQDVTIAGYAHERGCGCVFVLNKWDLLKDKEKSLKKFREDFRMNAKFLYYAPIITISALTGMRVNRIFGQVEEVYRQHTHRIPTGELNRILESALERTPPSLHKGKRLRFYYATQVGVKPCTIVCFVNYPEAVHFSYQRFLVNQVRELTGMDKAPLTLLFRQRTGRIEFEDPGENTHARNMGHKDKASRNKEQKKRERKAQSARKILRDGGEV